ncbi:sigma-70 family RNA polymerase sigma factor [Phyllobacterium sp. TAF24]|uniref:sigma-70 family RNA polymerase sigma factor n=1 Tax=Phyllobacterium sp. TAF24 TaxID=3233068 RepID=UPI003F95409D
METTKTKAISRCFFQHQCIRWKYGVGSGLVSALIRLRCICVQSGMDDFGTLTFGNFNGRWLRARRSMPKAGKTKSAIRRSFQAMTEAVNYSAKITRIAAHGDKVAFAEIFAYFAPRIKGFFMRGGMAPGQAEELAQETMLTVWRKAQLFDSTKASASTWIFTIARNLRVDAIRRERYPAAHLMDEPEFESSPSDDLLRVESEERVRRAMRELSSDQMNVIQLHYFDDKPHSEIARALDLPLGTVKSRLRLAMQHLRNLLGEE